MADEGDPVVVAAWRVDAGHPREALDALRDADAFDLRAIYVRGQALADLGRFDEAQDEVRRGLELEPENVALLELLATVQMNGDANAAEVTLRKAIALSPANPRLLSLYTMILMEQDRFEWAEKMLDRAMRVAPEDETVRRTRSLFLMRAAGSKEARAAALELLREYPDEAFAHYLRGLTLIWANRGEGLRHLREAAALRPQDPLLAETARVMRSWYLWPVHVTSGVTHWVINAAAFVAMIAALATGGPFWTVVLIFNAYIAYKWGAYFFAQALIRRRVTRALRER